MKKGKIVFTLIMSLLITIRASAQDQKPDPRFEKFMNKVAASKGVDISNQPKPAHANEFFKTYEDYLAGKPEEGIKLTDGFKGGKKPTLYVNQKGKDVQLKVPEITEYWGYVNKYGSLCRIYNGRVYQVLVQGKIFQYTDYDDCSANSFSGDSIFNLLPETTPGPDGRPHTEPYDDFLSFGPTGEIVGLDCYGDKHCEKLRPFLADHPEIYTEYDNDKTDHFPEDKYKTDKRSYHTRKIQQAIRKYNLL